MSTNLWEPCPRCGSLKVTKNTTGCLFALLGIATIGVFFWVTLFLPVLGIIGMIIGALFFLVSPIIGIANKGKWECKECHFLFMPTKSIITCRKEDTEW